MHSLLSALPDVFVPLTIIIAITSVFGVLGNLLAFYVFSFRFSSSGFNILMAALAVYDIIACLIHMPLDIASFLEVGHIRPYLCKITCFQLAFTASGSAIILLAVAIVRFYGINKPMLGLLPPKSAYYIILVSVLMAIGIGLPITFLFGAGDLLTDANITAEICAVEHKFMDTKGPLAYYFVLAAMYIMTFVAHSCLYAKSMHKLWTTKRVFVSMRGKSNVVMMSPAPARSNRKIAPQTRTEQIKTMEMNRSRADSGSSQSSQTRLCPKNDSNRSENVADSIDNLDAEEGQGNSLRAGTSSANMDDEIVVTRHDSRKGRSPRTARKNGSTFSSNQKSKTSSMASSNSKTNSTASSRKSSSAANQSSYRVLGLIIAISMTYFLSYAPHFGVMFYLFTHDMTVFRASAQNLAFELLMRSFFLNNILDPVIYGLMSRDFRREVVRIFRRTGNGCCSR